MPDILWMAGGHSDNVTAAAFSPDGQLLASGSRDGTIRLWRVSDGALLDTYDEETGPAVLTLAYSPDGSRLAWGRNDGTVVMANVPLAPSPVSSPGAGKTLSEGGRVSLPGQVVSAAFEGFFYAQSPDRSSGIRVQKAGHGLTAGTVVDVVGTLKTNADGERYIEASSAVTKGTDALVPLDMAQKALGGGAFGDPPAGQAGVTGGAGLNNIGLLVRTAGRVTFVDPGGQFFNVWDGSPVKDSEGREGVRVYAPGLTLPGAGEFVVVTGISSCVKSGQQLYPLLRVRTQGDIAQP